MTSTKKRGGLESKIEAMKQGSSSRSISLDDLEQFLKEKGDVVPIWINPVEGCITEFFQYGEDLRKTAPMDDQRYHGFAKYKISLPKSQISAFVTCVKKGDYEVKVESDAFVSGEIRVYKAPPKPLTKEEIDSRLQDIEMRNIRQVAVPPPSFKEAKPKSIAFYDPKKREALYQSQDRGVQEAYLLELEQSLKEKYEAAEKDTGEALHKSIDAFKKQCEAILQEAKQKVSEGQDKKTVFEQAVKKLDELQKHHWQAWKGGWWSGEGAAVYKEYVQTLEKEFNLKRKDETELLPYDSVEGNNEFSFDLYKKMREEKGNLFFSPFSILAAFAMTVEGAKGKTAEEIQAVFHFPKDLSQLRDSFLSLYTKINQKGTSYKLHTANALWVQKGAKLMKTYQKLIRSYYGGEATEINFSASEKTAKLINQWIEAKTNHKITNFFSPEAFDQWTRLVLTNAIYFKGLWEEPFDKKDTKEEEFQLSAGEKQKVPMMRLEDRELKFPYAETESFQFLEMSYKGEELSMLILLPKKVGLKSVENDLTLEKLKDWKGLLKSESVFIYLPKFTFKKRIGLDGLLRTMGMPTSFSMKADFSGMFGKNDIYITAVVHEAFVDVNEEGTEAAAVTGVEAEEKAELLEERLFIFRADHPFLFFIQQRKTGHILFMGRVENPK